jgi:hypothetical protein
MEKENKFTSEDIGDGRGMIDLIKQYRDDEIKREKIRDAAPDLLAACEAALEYIKAQNAVLGEYPGSMVLKQLREAISRAKGE